MRLSVSEMLSGSCVLRASSLPPPLLHPPSSHRKLTLFKEMLAGCGAGTCQVRLSAAADVIELLATTITTSRLRPFALAAFHPRFQSAAHCPHDSTLIDPPASDKTVQPHGQAEGQ